MTEFNVERLLRKGYDVPSSFWMTVASDEEF